MVFVFDFDGTLVDSNKTKEVAFLQLCANNRERSYMSGLLKDRGKIRYEIIEVFCMQFNYNCNDLINSLDEDIERRVKKSQLRQGALETLSCLRESQHGWHINSATPDSALKSLIQHFFPFREEKNLVIGSSMGKTASLVHISRIKGVSPAEMVFFGDGIDDWEASKQFGCKFIAVAGGSLQDSGEDVEYHDKISLVSVNG